MKIALWATSGLLVFPLVSMSFCQKVVFWTYFGLRVFQRIFQFKMTSSQKIKQVFFRSAKNNRSDKVPLGYVRESVSEMWLVWQHLLSTKLWRIVLVICQLSVLLARQKKTKYEKECGETKFTVVGNLYVNFYVLNSMFSYNALVLWNKTEYLFSEIENSTFFINVINVMVFLIQYLLQKIFLADV